MALLFYHGSLRRRGGFFKVCGATELVEGQSKLLNLEEEFLG